MPVDIASDLQLSLLSEKRSCFSDNSIADLVRVAEASSIRSGRTERPAIWDSVSGQMGFDGRLIGNPSSE